MNYSGRKLPMHHVRYSTRKPDHSSCKIIAQLCWLNDVKDLLDNHMPEAGGLAYDIMFNIARRQLLIGIMRWLEQIFPPYRQQAQ